MATLEKMGYLFNPSSGHTATKISLQSETCREEAHHNYQSDRIGLFLKGLNFKLINLP